MEKDEILIRVKEILSNLDAYERDFWPRHRKLVASANNDKPHNISYPSCLRAIRQIGVAILDEGKSLPPKNPPYHCAYCDQRIKNGEPSVPDDCGEKGDRLHLHCSVAQADGDAINNEKGDS